jgi:hypothetical protein
LNGGGGREKSERREQKMRTVSQIHIWEREPLRRPAVVPLHPSSQPAILNAHVERSNIPPSLFLQHPESAIQSFKTSSFDRHLEIANEKETKPTFSVKFKILPSAAILNPHVHGNL